MSMMMKTTTLSFLLLVSSLLFVFATKPSDATPDPVLDTNGDPLRTGARYLISPIIWGAGGGPFQLGGRNKSCPLKVVRTGGALLLDPIPLTFLSVTQEKGAIVRLSTDYNIKFLTTIPCNVSTVWKLGSLDAWARSALVTIGGVEGNPGPETINNWFKIEKYLGNYKLVICPQVCNFCRVYCSDLGLLADMDGDLRLAVPAPGDTPYNVLFQKAGKKLSMSSTI